MTQALYSKTVRQDVYIPPMARVQPATIVVEGLHKSFGGVHTLNGIDLVVQPGAVLGLLGPSTAGKTTLVRILTTLLTPDAGRA